MKIKDEQLKEQIENNPVTKDQFEPVYGYGSIINL